MAGHTLLETARDSLFLANVPATQLPFVYIGVAAVSLVMGLGRGARTSKKTSLTLWLLLSSGFTLSFWPFIGGGGWAPYGLYLWSAIAVTATLVRFYAILAHRFTPTQAKRLYPIIGAGSIAGALAGSLVAVIATTWLPSKSLLILASGFFAFSSLGPLALSADPDGLEDALPTVKEKPPVVPMLEPLKSPYVTRLGILILLATVSFTLIDFSFKSLVAEEVKPSELGTFFGRLYLALNLISLFIQLTVVRRIIHKFGPPLALTVLPALIVCSYVSSVGLGLFKAALLAKGVDGALRHSLYRTSVELLFVPLDARIRSASKSLIEVVAQRGGQALASVCILVFVALEAPPLAHLTLAAALATLITVLGIRARGLYIDLFSRTLARVAEQQRAFPDLDIASLESLIAALGSRDDNRVSLALKLFAARAKVHLIPTLIFYHPSPKVLIVALDLFTDSGRVDFLPNSDPLLVHQDSGVRAAALRARLRIKPDQALIRENLDSACPIVRASAMVGLQSYFPRESGDVRLSIKEMAFASSVEERKALAHAIGYGRAGALDEWIVLLAKSCEEEVLTAVIGSMNTSPQPRYIPHLIRFLQRRGLRAAAAATLARLGEVALSSLEGVLLDEDETFAAREKVPQAIAYFPPPRASRVLLDALADVRDIRIRAEILRSLHRVVSAEDMDLKHDERLSQAMILRWATDAYRLLDWCESVRAGASSDLSSHQTLNLLIQVLGELHRKTIVELLMLIETIFRDSNVALATQSALSKEPSLRSSAYEVIESILPKKCRLAVMGLLDDLPDTEKLYANQGFYRSTPLNGAALFETLSKYDSNVVKTLARLCWSEHPGNDQSLEGSPS